MFPFFKFSCSPPLTCQFGLPVKHRAESSSQDWAPLLYSHSLNAASLLLSLALNKLSNEEKPFLIAWISFFIVVCQKKNIHNASDSSLVIMPYNHIFQEFKCLSSLILLRSFASNVSISSGWFYQQIMMTVLHSTAHTMCRTVHTSCFILSS